MKLSLHHPRRWGFIALAMVVAAGAWMALIGRGRAPVGNRHPSLATAKTNPPASRVADWNSTARSGTPTADELARRAALFGSFQRHPFAVSRETAAYGWTAEDGKDPDVIHQLAHNELEFERMAEESPRIRRRQLVYAKTTADLLIQQSRLSGEPVRQMALPGLDGQEIPFAIAREDLSPSGQQGTFTGEWAGRPGSTVTLAFKGGREAFTVLSPADQLYLVGEPREPGELIVKSIDPKTYVPGVCGNPD